MVKLAGFAEAMREHVPVLLAKLRERFPGLKVTLQEIDQRGGGTPDRAGRSGPCDYGARVEASARVSLRDLGPSSALPARER